MKKSLVILFILSLVISINAGTERLKPYILAGIEKGEITDVITKTEALLTES